MQRQAHPRELAAVAITLCAAVLVCVACGARESTQAAPTAAAVAEASAQSAARRVVFEARSPFNHIRVVDERGIRTLLFVRDNGEEVTESAMNVLRGDQLVLRYMHGLFLTHLFAVDQKRCLIIGLGGGDMVRFQRAHFPGLAIDAVEIDPVVIEVAKQHFRIEPGPKLRIFEQDGYEFLEAPGESYDAIYLDAFMVPSAETDSQGAPLSMKSEAFLQGVRTRLTPSGVLAINLNRTAQTAFDIAAFASVFPNGSRIAVPGTGNIILLGASAPLALDAARARAADLASTGLELASLLPHVEPVAAGL